MFVRNLLPILFAVLFLAGCDRDISVSGVYFPRWMVLLVVSSLPSFILSSWLRKKVPDFDPWWFEVTRLSIWVLLFFSLELLFAFL